MVFQSPSIGYSCLPFVYVWKSAGYQCIIYLASIIGINEEYYEAAELDGRLGVAADNQDHAPR